MNSGAPADSGKSHKPTLDPDAILGSSGGTAGIHPTEAELGGDPVNKKNGDNIKECKCYCPLPSQPCLGSRGREFLLKFLS